MTAPPMEPPRTPAAEPVQDERPWLRSHAYAAVAGTASFGLLIAGGSALSSHEHPAVTLTWVVLIAMGTFGVLAMPLAFLSLPSTYLFHLVNRRLRLRNPLWFMGYGALVSIPLPILFTSVLATEMTGGLAHGPEPLIGGISVLSVQYLPSLFAPALSGALGGLAYWWATRPCPAADCPASSH